MTTDDKECPRTNTPTNGNMAMPCHLPQWPPELLQMTKNTQERIWTTPPLTNNGQHLQTDTGDNVLRSASSLPPPFFFCSNTKCRCHITVSDVAMKWWTTTKNHHSLLLGHHGKYPPQFIPTHLAQTQHNDGLTTWVNNDAARTGTTTTSVAMAQLSSATAQLTWLIQIFS